MARAVVIHNDKLLVNKRNRFGNHYYGLPGGGVEPGESFAEAAVRETQEEASVSVEIIQELYEWRSAKWGHTKFYLCRYVSGEPRVADDAPEAADNKAGKNTYEPMWIAIEELATINLLPPVLKDRLLRDISGGFPATTIQFKDA